MTFDTSVMEKESVASSKTSQWRTKKNFIVLCFAFVLLYTPYNAVANLQSSIHSEEGVGLYSLAINSGSSILSYLFFTVPIIFIGGYKWTIVAAQIGFLLFVLGNIYPKAWVLFSVSAICGLLRAGLWTAQGAYVAEISNGRCNGNTDAAVKKYFGIFFSIFQTSQIWGNLITYLIFPMSPSSASHNLSLCGADFLAAEHVQEESHNRISNKTAYILCGVFIGLIVLCLVLIVTMLDQKRKWKKPEPKAMVYDTIRYIASTFQQMKTLRQILLMPLAFWIGTSGAFMFGIFTNSFITCTAGLQYVSLVMISFGVAACLFSILVGYIGRFNCHFACFAFAAILCYASYTVMLLWKPLPSQIYVLYIMAAISGVANAIWDPVEAALYGTLFTDNIEAAFSNMWLGQNVGYLVVYLYGPSLRTRTAIILQIVYLTLAMIGYFALEIQQYRHRKLKSSVVVTEVSIQTRF